MVRALGADAVGEEGLSDVGAVVAATEPALLAALRERMPHAVSCCPGSERRAAGRGPRARVRRPPAAALVTVSRTIAAAALDAGSTAAALPAAERLRESPRLGLTHGRRMLGAYRGCRQFPPAEAAGGVGIIGPGMSAQQQSSLRLLAPAALAVLRDRLPDRRVASLGGGDGGVRQFRASAASRRASAARARRASAVAPARDSAT